MIRNDEKKQEAAAKHVWSDLEQVAFERRLIPFIHPEKKFLDIQGEMDFMKHEGAITYVISAAGSYVMTVKNATTFERLSEGLELYKKKVGRREWAKRKEQEDLLKRAQDELQANFKTT